MYEWQRSLYVNFVDFAKAFDSVHRDSPWRILRGYGIPEEEDQNRGDKWTPFSYLEDRD